MEPEGWGAVARTALTRVSRRERGILGDSDFRSRLFFFSLFRNILTSVLEPPDVDPTATLCMPGCPPRQVQVRSVRCRTAFVT